MAGSMTVDRASRDRIDQWFVVHGFPLLAREPDNKWGGAGPALTFLLILAAEAAVLGIQPDASAAYNIFSILSGPASMLGLLLIYGRFSNLPFGLWLLITVTVPALPALVFSQDLSLFVLAILANYALFFGIRLWIRKIQVGSLLRWSLGATLMQVPHLVGVVVRALPVLFVAIFILFFTAEIWQAAHRLDSWFILLAPGSLLLVAIVVQVVHLDRMTKTYWQAATRTDSTDESVDKPDWTRAEAEMRKLAERFPHLRSVLELAVPASHRRAPHLHTLVRANIFLLLLFSQNLQLTVTCLSLGLFLLLFGAVSFTLETQASFVGATDASQLFRLFSTELMGREVVVTSSLAKVALFLSAIAYLSFVLYAASNSNYDRDFLRHIKDRIHEAILVRHFSDCVFWRPSLWQSSKEQCTITFTVPPGVKAGSAVLVWRNIDNGYEDRTEMTVQQHTFGTSLLAESNATLHYHYEIDGVPMHDWRVDEISSGVGDIDVSVLKVCLDV